MKKFMFLFLLSSCGIHILYESKPPPKDLNGQFLKGTVYDYKEKKNVDLVVFQKHSIVFIFSTYTCTSCGEEADNLSSYLSNSGNKEKFLSIFVASDEFEAEDWKQNHKAQWNVFLDIDNDAVFKTYCEGQVPCIIVQTPDKGIVLKHTGKVEISELIKLVGEK